MTPSLSPPCRRLVARIAAVACPPGARVPDRSEALVREFGLALGALSPFSRRTARAGLVVLDHRTRFMSRARGRRFSRLDDERADACLEAMLSGKGLLRTVARSLTSLVVMCYYELPDVKEEIGYRPGPYIAAVTRRRQESYADQISAAEAAVLADEAG